MRYLITSVLVTAVLLTSCSMVADDGAVPTTEPAQAPVKATELASTAVPTTKAMANALETTATPQPITEQPTEAGSNLLNWMMADAAIRTDTPPLAIRFQSLEEVDWPDASLGCPAPDQDYAQVVTPGIRVTLTVGGDDYVYHADKQDNFVLCQNGRPQSPVEDFAEEWK